jgi:hypothetical protein
VTEQQALDYVKAASVALGIPMDEARAAAVAVHFARTAAMAALLEQAGLREHDEADEIYCPKPFPGAPGLREQL